jgi:hypothetical protein
MRNLFTKSRAGAEFAGQIFNIGILGQGRELESAAFDSSPEEVRKWKIGYDLGYLLS